MRGCQTICFRCIPSRTNRLTRNSLFLVLLTEPARIWRHINACVHALQNFEKI